MLLWEVKHPDHEAVQVEAIDRLHAVVEAAHAWGIIRWTDVARECKADLLGEAPKKPSQALRARSPKEGAKKGAGK